MDHFTETSHTGFLENIGNSFKGILFGFLLLAGSIYLLSYNEHRSINQTLALEEMQSKIITLENTNYNAQYEKSPVLLQGEVLPKKELEDRLFGIKSNGLVLERNVEMYQWVEHTSSKSEDKLGGGTETVTTYDYKKEWSSSTVDSSSFRYSSGHENTSMAYHRESFSTDANLGDFYLSKNIIKHFSNRESFNGLTKMPEKIGEMKNYKSYLYKGSNPEHPLIGDIKISYKEAGQGFYSLAGMVQGKALVPYISENDKNLFFVRVAKVSAHQIFKEEFDANTLLTWVLRAVGLMLMFFGFMLIMGPLETLANVIPMLGSVIGGASALVAGVLTLLLGSLVIAIAWFASRPLLSLTIIGVGIGLTFILKSFKKDKESAFSSQSTPPPRRNKD